MFLLLPVCLWSSSWSAVCEHRFCLLGSLVIAETKVQGFESDLIQLPLFGGVEPEIQEMETTQCVQMFLVGWIRLRLIMVIN